MNSAPVSMKLVSAHRHAILAHIVIIEPQVAYSCHFSHNTHSRRKLRMMQRFDDIPKSNTGHAWPKISKVAHWQYHMHWLAHRAVSKVWKLLDRWAVVLYPGLSKPLFIQSYHNPLLPKDVKTFRERKHSCQKNIQFLKINIYRRKIPFGMV